MVVPFKPRSKEIPVKKCFLALVVVLAFFLAKNAGAAQIRGAMHPSYSYGGRAGFNPGMHHPRFAPRVPNHRFNPGMHNPKPHIYPETVPHHNWSNDFGSQN